MSVVVSYILHGWQWPHGSGYADDCGNGCGSGVSGGNSGTIGIGNECHCLGIGYFCVFRHKKNA